MRTFIVEMDIVTPVHIRETMYLDGMLAYIKREMGASLDDALNDLPLVKRESNDAAYWAASRFFYQHIPSFDGTQRKSMPFDSYLNYSSGKNKMSMGSGSAKSYLNKLHLSHIGKAVAFGVGDVDEVDYLLQHIGYFGSLSRAGYGKIIAAKADEFDEDWSEMIDDQCVRAMPRSISDADVMASCAPPYWDKLRAIPVCLPSAKNPPSVQKIFSKHKVF